MTESEYWKHLEYRLCDEFQGLPERRYHYFWCDGVYPEEYILDGPAPRITGSAYICNGQRQYQWSFVLLLPRPCPSRENLDWASLLPPNNMTRWMCFNEDNCYLEIEPAVAVPDLL